MYSFITSDPSGEDLICAISTFGQTAEQPVWDNLGTFPNDVDLNTLLSGSSEALLLMMFVGDNGDYTFWGPVALNQPSPCDYRPGPTPIPTLGAGGFAALFALLAGSALWFLRRRRPSR
jgi:hypothetical protein